MGTISQVLAVVDPTAEKQPALERAAFVARQTGASLEAFICAYNEHLAGNRFDDSKSLADARVDYVHRQKQRADELVKSITAEGVAARAHAAWGHPLDESIVARAKEIKADIVFKDTHHHSAVSRTFFTNTDWNLIRNVPALLWLVKAGNSLEQAELVAAIDPMNDHDKPAALDDRILKTGRMLEDALPAHLSVFHSYDPRVAFAAATANAYVPVSLPLKEVEEQMHEDHLERVLELARYHEIDADDVHLKCGRTHEELAAFASDKNASLVIMGAVARSRLQRVFIGSTAERTLEHLPCDLLIVKPDGIGTSSDAGRDD